MEKDNEAKGIGNSLDFGARIYDSRLGRFLSLDPRMADFPFMTPYCFAANSPIYYIDKEGEGPEDFIYRALGIDMSKCPATYKSVSGKIVKTTYTVKGAPRNNLYFWDKFVEMHPGVLDKANNYRVSKLGLSPKVTQSLLNHLTAGGWNTKGLVINEVIDHNHIDNGPQAKAQGRSNHKEYHKVNGSGRSASAKLGGVHAIAGLLFDVAGAINGNPESIYTWNSEPEVGKIKKAIGGNGYYVPTSMERDENSVTMDFDIYSSSKWDEKQKKYVGDNKVGTGTLYEEEGGYRELSTYDKKGELVDYQTEGTPQAPKS